MEAAHIVVFAIFLFEQCPISAGYNTNNNACRNYSDYLLRFWSKHCHYNPNVLSNTPTMIKTNDYPLEAYTLTTQDGYILTIFRIPPRNHKRNKQPVFLMHGILSNSELWVHLGNRSLAFNLADQGYDVWLGTVRGSSFARTHVYYKMSNKEYWNFNLDSLAYFDVGEQLKFVANKTKKWGSVIYVGHSMGTTLSFMYASGYPSEANSLLSGIIALAPVVYLKDLRLIDAIMEVSPALERLLEKFHIEGLFQQESVQKYVVKICGFLPHVCKRILEICAGDLTDQFLPDDLLLFFSHSLAPLSVRVLRHYKQIYETGRLRRFDYGKLKNIEIYRLSEPRSYNLKYIKVPVYLFYGKNDALVSEKNVEALFRQLGSTRKTMQRIPKDINKAAFNHVDFLMAKNIKQYLYAEMFRVMQEQIKRN